MNFSNTLRLAAVVSALGISSVHAAVTVVAPTATTAGSITFGHDIVFTISETVTSRLNFVFDEWVTTPDAVATATSLTPQFRLSINNGSATNFATLFYDNRAATAIDISPNDGYINLAFATTVTAGSTVAILSGTHSLTAWADFNSLTTQTFTGNMFVTNQAGTRISDIVNVPEPVTPVFMGLGLAAMCARRSRRQGLKS